MPPTVVDILYIDEDRGIHKATDGDVISFEDGNHGGLVCDIEVDGDDAAPDVTITLDDVDIIQRYWRQDLQSIRRRLLQCPSRAVWVAKITIQALILILPTSLHDILVLQNA